MGLDAESLALVIRHQPQQACACMHVSMCLCARRACVSVIKAKFIGHQPVPICFMNIAQNHKQKEDGEGKRSEEVKKRKINEGMERERVGGAGDKER